MGGISVRLFNFCASCGSHPNFFLNASGVKDCSSTLANLITGAPFTMG